MGDSDPRLTALEHQVSGLRRAISLLHRIANLTRETLELRPTYYAVLTGVTAGVGLGLNRAMLFLLDPEDRSVLRGVAAVGPNDGAEADRVWREIEADAPDLRTLYQAGLRAMHHPDPLDHRVRSVEISADADHMLAKALGRTEPVRGTSTTDDLDGLLDLPTGIAACVRGRERVLGVLYADNRFTGRQLDPIGEMVLAMVADHAGRAIDNASRYERVARQARTDALTGLGHHGALMGAVLAAVDEAREQNTPLSVAMIDLDDFKKVNDEHGHLVGDELLAAVAGRLREAARAGTAYRYGGEEFTVLLAGVDLDGAVVIGERLRAAIADRPFPMGNGTALQATCSVGLAATTPERSSPRALLAAADAALLRAKATGKNRVQRA